jgi:AcrR family transcriptional regulator
MVSNKNKDSSGKRTYTLRARARRQEEVHRRITLATVHLHGTVGPARTTVSDIAKLAGVRRATVYNHFPTDLELIDACSSHWFAENPPPDPAPWAEILDPGCRVETALAAMYEYYDRGQEMMENVLRDAPLVAALEKILQQKWLPMMEGIVGILAEGWRSNEVGTHATGADGMEHAKIQPIRQGGEVELRASLRVALDFFTWQTLATTSGLSNDEAARLAAAWVEAVRTLPL